MTDQDFEILKLRYTDQVELTRYMSSLELKVLFGYFASIGALVAWLTTKVQDKVSSLGFLVAVVVIATSCVVLYLASMKRRRNEAVETIRNLNEALGYTEVGRFVDGKAINAKHPSHIVYSSTFYVYIVSVVLVGMASVIFISSFTS